MRRDSLTGSTPLETFLPDGYIRWVLVLLSLVGNGIFISLTWSVPADGLFWDADIFDFAIHNLKSAIDNQLSSMSR